MIYFDTSAFVKLVWPEAESAALREYLLDGTDVVQVSSKLLVVEARRTAVRLARPQAHVDGSLEQVTLIDIDDTIIESASRLTEPSLRSLDAVHLATALRLGGDVDELITYDQRLADVAAASGLDVAAPGR